MSLFVGNLAFANDMQYIDGVKIGVLAVHCFQHFWLCLVIIIFKKMITKKLLRLLQYI